MTEALLQILSLLGLGVIWSIIKPAGMDIAVIRNALTNTVYYVFLPALVLKILWQSPLDITSIKISISAIIGILGSLVLASFACRMCGARREVTGAIMLAAAFPNATYLGLPLLENTFGPWARSIAIQFDMFACFPLVLTVGIIIANRFGSKPQPGHPLLSLISVVPLWAVAVAITLNLLQVGSPAWVDGLLEMLSNAVIPLMLFAAGMALPRGLKEFHNLPTVIPVAVIQLFIMPLIVWMVAGSIGVSGETLRALVIEAALPSMALGIVLCDRFGLNTGIYAAALTLTTALSFFTLPLWYHWI
jgi:predicted permease